MTVKNLEKTVLARIVTQLAYPTGTGNYNNSIAAGQVHSEFKMITEIHKFPAFCIGSVNIETDGSIRGIYQVPITVEIFGYVNSEDSPMDEALKLLSDLRIALTTDEFLNNGIRQFGLSAEVGAMDGFGIFLATIKGVMEHRS